MTDMLTEVEVTEETETIQLDEGARIVVYVDNVAETAEAVLYRSSDDLTGIDLAMTGDKDLFNNLMWLAESAAKHHNIEYNVEEVEQEDG